LYLITCFTSLTVSKCSNMFAHLEVVGWLGISFISSNESLIIVCLYLTGKWLLLLGEGQDKTSSGSLVSLNPVLIVSRNHIRSKKTIRMQERSQTSNAITELEIGADNLQNKNDKNDKDTTTCPPGTVEHVDEEEADAKQETEPGQNCGQEEASLKKVQFCLRIIIY
jgi:hypothetical protein